MNKLYDLQEEELNRILPKIRETLRKEKEFGRKAGILNALKEEIQKMSDLKDAIESFGDIQKGIKSEGSEYSKHQIFSKEQNDEYYKLLLRLKEETIERYGALGEMKKQIEDLRDETEAENTLYKLISKFFDVKDLDRRRCGTDQEYIEEINVLIQFALKE